MAVWMDGRVDRRTDGFNGWMDGWKDEWMKLRQEENNVKEEYGRIKLKQPTNDDVLEFKGRRVHCWVQ